MGFSRQEYWSGVPLPSPHLHLVTLNIQMKLGQKRLADLVASVSLM